jgi:MoxR-like ATPase
MTNQYAAEAEIAEAGAKLGRLREALNTVLFGQEKLIGHVITGLLARGHLLIEGLPGLGKDGTRERPRPSVAA